MSTYHIFRAPEGGDLEYAGARPTLAEAQGFADSEPRTLDACLWETARAAGHCDGIGAPPQEAVDGDAHSWHGARGDYCVVVVA
jgi:hypothetical protein